MIFYDSDYVYTALYIAESLGIAYSSMPHVVNMRDVLDADDFTVEHDRYRFSQRAYDKLRDYVNPPAGWIPIRDVAAELDMTTTQVRSILARIPNYRSYYKRFYRVGVLYNPDVIDVIRKMPKRQYVTLQKDVPNQEWFNAKEFGDLFGKTDKSTLAWIYTGRVPREFVKWEDRRYCIHKDAIPYVDGKAYDANNKGFYRYEAPGEQDLVDLDGYKLTPEQQKRRIKIFYNYFHQITPETSAWLASQGLTADDLTD